MATLARWSRLAKPAFRPFTCPREHTPDPATLDAAIREVQVAADVDVVFLAGYMKKLGPFVLGTFQGRILNTHPAFLPRFGGRGMYGGSCVRGGA
jgi:folate-dependent phosphoribosylglycinamide formyltransferase PurN